MKKNRILVVIGVLAFVIVLLLLACLSLHKPMTREPKQSSISIEDVLKSYETGRVLSSHKIGTDFLLVEHQEDTLANRFYLHDLKSGRIDILPTGAEFVSLEEISDENHIVLRASGTNSESTYTTFPYWMHFFRNTKAVESDPAFYVQKEDRFFELTTSVSAGSKPICQLKTIKLGVAGIEFIFAPVAGQEAEFYAGFTDIPPTDIRYDASKKMLSITFKGISVDDQVLSETWTGESRYGYIRDLSMEQVDEDLVVKLTLKTAELLYLPSISLVGPYEGSTEDVAVLGIIFKQEPQ